MKEVIIVKESFKREEIKYLLNEEMYNKVMNGLSDYLVKDEYYESKILNIYYDTPNYDLLIKSIDKPIYKEKVRLRSYKVPSLKDNVFLEVKKKYKGVVSKRRVVCTLNECYNYYNKKEMIKKSKMKELDYLFKHYDLEPKIFIGYDRLSYKLKDDNEVRITFDTNIRSRTSDLSLEMGDAGNLYFKEKTYIMEIKALDSLPLYVTKLLNENKIYPVSFSKVGAVYKKMKGSELCLTA